MKRRDVAWILILIVDVGLIAWGAGAALAPDHLLGPGGKAILPAGYEGTRPQYYLSTGLVLKGDFEVTMSFEILELPEPEDAGPETGITLQTDDIEAYRARLAERGVDVDAEVSRMGDPVPPLCWFRDPEGNVIGLWQTA